MRRNKKVKKTINEFEVAFGVEIIDPLLNFFFCDYSEATVEVQSSTGGTNLIRVLDFDTSKDLYNKLLEDSTYNSIFHKTYIPIAADKIENPCDVLCYDLKTRKLFLYWLLLWDPFNPIEWQLEVKEVTETLDSLMDILGFQHVPRLTTS